MCLRAIKTPGLATLVMTDKSPDIAVFGRSGFNCITKGLAQPIDAYIDLSHPYYRDLQEAYALTEWSGGQHYKLIRNLVKLGGMLYNTKMLEDAGQPDLWELYKKNEWTWDSFGKYRASSQPTPTAMEKTMCLPSACSARRCSSIPR